MDADSTRQFWSAYANTAKPSAQTVRILSFGDRAELADELTALVIAGVKRATTSLKRDFDGPGDTLPKPGDFSIVIDGDKVPRCIVQTSNVDVRPMREVDERFARDEGGGDRTLSWWISANMRYFKRRAEREGFAIDDGVEVVLERFRVVWPPEYADRVTS